MRSSEDGREGGRNRTDAADRGRKGGRGTHALQREKVEMRAPSSFLPSLLGCERGAMQTKAPCHGASSTCRPSLKKYHSCLYSSCSFCLTTTTAVVSTGGREEGIYFQSNWRPRKKRERERSTTDPHASFLRLPAFLPPSLPPQIPDRPSAPLQHEKHAMSIGPHRVACACLARIKGTLVQLREVGTSSSSMTAMR